MIYEKYYQRFLDHNPYPRSICHIDSIMKKKGSYVKKNGKILINFASNDYLGLAKHALLIARSQEFITSYGIGAASSRLVTGNLSIYEQLEQQLAKAIGKPAALILATGFQANISVLEALLDANVLEKRPFVFCDRLCHISMLMNTRYLSHMKRFRHNDLNHLENLLKKYRNSDHPKFILAESIYSMEGDQADLKGLVELAKKYHAFLYIDDAHAVGVDGPQGFGKAAAYAGDIDIIMGTFSKALGSFGSYIACSETIRDYLINKCKGLIYSTGLSPAILGAISAAIELVPQLKNERNILLTNAQRVYLFFKEEGLYCGAADTHIIPWISGDAKKTLLISRLLEDHGIVASAIRPPSVPSDQCRVRFCLSAAHHDNDINQLMAAVRMVVSQI